MIVVPFDEVLGTGNMVGLSRFPKLSQSVQTVLCPGTFGKDWFASKRTKTLSFERV